MANPFPVILTFLLCVLFGQIEALAQKDNIRRLVDTLASPHLEGRGYVDSGLQKAASFIESEYRLAGLKPIEDTYRQSFTHDVVVFDGNVKLTLNGKVLKPGIDFLVSPGSKAVKAASKKLVPLDSIRWIDPNARVVFEMVDKLTWGVASVQDDYAVFYVLNSALPEPPVSYVVDLDARRIKGFSSENIVGIIKGSERPDSLLVISAHYDHLGKLGRDAVFCGANDNASGVALMLDLAKQLGAGASPPRYSVMFIAFAGEEVGLLGSAHYVQNPLFPLENIRFLINLDLLGTGEEGIMVVNASEYPDEWQLLDSLNKANNWLKQVGQRGKARNSDHYWFTEAGVPAFFIYTLGGISAYHDVYDVRETLPLTKTEDVGKLILSFLDIISNRY